MATVVVNPLNVVNTPEIGGHFWVYMQYVHSLLQLGCDVYWLERFHPSTDQKRDAALLANFIRRMHRYGLGEKVILYTERDGDGGMRREFISIQRSKAEEVLRRADLLLNFHYAMSGDLLSQFRRTALVDIDPGLLQFWISTAQLTVPKHDFYFTTGETVGLPGARFSDCGLSWTRIRPPVCLDLWPFVRRSPSDAFTTVSSWWGDEFVSDGKNWYENNKRVTFLNFIELPRRTRQPLELALCLGKGDNQDRQRLESCGWRIRQAAEVAASPESYRAYVQGSRGEFSCAKPSCMEFQNAWVSDRTLCYLASGRPTVVQNTGPSSLLPQGLGMFRFSTLQEAVEAFAIINADYQRHRRAAREIAEAFFDGKCVAERILRSALITGPAHRAA